MNPFDEYKITSPYGDRISPITKKPEKHTGIDLVIAHQANIKSFTDGKCIFAQFAQSGTGVGGFGNTVLIEDKNKYIHLYGHLDSISVKENTQIKRGDIVGKQGNTGQSAGSHLHYEIREKNSPNFGWRTDIEPTQYLINFYKNDIEELNNQNIEEIINYLGTAWKNSKDEKEKNRIHQLANILRTKKS